MQVCDTKIQTPQQREEALRKLMRAVFHDASLANRLVHKQSGTFNDDTLLDHAKKGVKEYRAIEDFLLEYANEIDGRELAS